jgi:hypothetical protein
MLGMALSAVATGGLDVSDYSAVRESLYNIIWTQNYIISALGFLFLATVR